MEVKIDFAAPVGKIKPMHAVNNAPKKTPRSQSRGNFEAFKRACIPYARTHDASLCQDYGGAHTIDITAIFPDFDKDEQDEKNYDFFYTDKYCKDVIDAGTQVFFRLGQAIEHGAKRYGVVAPKDNLKWAKICEKIIMHLNYGWANGYNMGIEYWEIWNEPDLKPDDSPDQVTWQGTQAQFYDFFETAAKYLKSKFPSLKIGGPAFAGCSERIEPCLVEMGKRKVPLDFVSWHIYSSDPYAFVKRADEMRERMDRCGYDKAESICNEWNYVKGWSNEWAYSLRTESSYKGAAFVAQAMSVSQDSSIDMLMYYDARTRTPMNGMFDQYDLRPIKPYYPFLYWSVLAKLGKQYAAFCDDKEVYVTAAKDENGKAAILVTRYSEDNNKTCAIDVIFHTHGLAPARGKVFVTDEFRTNSYETNVDSDSFTLPLNPDSFALITFGDIEF
jgi:hypothetical protein